MVQQCVFEGAAHHDEVLARIRRLLFRQPLLRDPVILSQSLSHLICIASPAGQPLAVDLAVFKACYTLRVCYVYSNNSAT